MLSSSPKPELQESAALAEAPGPSAKEALAGVPPSGEEPVASISVDVLRMAAEIATCQLQPGISEIRFWV